MAALSARTPNAAGSAAISRSSHPSMFSPTLLTRSSVVTCALPSSSPRQTRDRCHRNQVTSPLVWASMQRGFENNTTTTGDAVGAAVSALAASRFEVPRAVAVQTSPLSGTRHAGSRKRSVSPVVAGIVPGMLLAAQSQSGAVAAASWVPLGTNSLSPRTWSRSSVPARNAAHADKDETRPDTQDMQSVPSARSAREASGMHVILGLTTPEKPHILDISVFNDTSGDGPAMKKTDTWASSTDSVDEAGSEDVTFIINTGFEKTATSTVERWQSDRASPVASPVGRTWSGCPMADHSDRSASVKIGRTCISPAASPRAAAVTGTVAAFVQPFQHLVPRRPRQRQGLPIANWAATAGRALSPGRLTGQSKLNAAAGSPVICLGNTRRSCVSPPPAASRQLCNSGPPPQASSRSAAEAARLSRQSSATNPCVNVGPSCGARPCGSAPLVRLSSTAKRQTSQQRSGGESNLLPVYFDGAEAGDPMDRMITLCLMAVDKDARPQLRTRKLSAGKYEVDGRRLSIRWSTAQGEAQLLVSEDCGRLEELEGPPPEIPFEEYIGLVANVASQRVGAGASAIARIPQEKRLTFGGEDGIKSPLELLDSSQRCESMKKACEEARLRELAASAYEQSAAANRGAAAFGTTIAIVRASSQQPVLSMTPASASTTSPAQCSSGSFRVPVPNRVATVFAKATAIHRANSPPPMIFRPGTADQPPAHFTDAAPIPNCRQPPDISAASAQRLASSPTNGTSRSGPFTARPCKGAPPPPVARSVPGQPPDFGACSATLRSTHTGGGSVKTSAANSREHAQEPKRRNSSASPSMHKVML